MPRFDEASGGGSVELGVGEDIEVSLPENPTAGFRWQIVQRGQPVVELLDEHFVPGLKATGQSGLHVWKFRVIAQGAGAIELVYRRSWEAAPTSSTARTFALRVTGKK
jgi:inhibitor of cysteine peptidase